MQTEHLQSFIALAEELHFGRAAQKLGILPASLGRHIRLLEESLAVPLFARTTRAVALTEEGSQLLAEVRPLMQSLEQIAARFRRLGRPTRPLLRLGAIDSVSAALFPLLLAGFQRIAPEGHIRLSEDKSARLIPKLQSGQLDLALIRPPLPLPRSYDRLDLGFETPVLALPEGHPLAERQQITPEDLTELALIVPDRRARPHSYDLTFRLLDQAGRLPRIAQVADEKQTILSLVAAGIGAAVVPRSSLMMRPRGVVALPVSQLSDENLRLLPLALIWPRAVRDPLRDRLIEELASSQEALEKIL